MVIIGPFALVFLPLIKKLKEKSNSLQLANIALETSNKEIKEKMDQVNALQADLKLKEEYNKIFIDMAPNAMAMFDTDMRFLAASDRWKSDYNLTDQEIIGKSLYEVFPKIDEHWKRIHQECLSGFVHHEDETAYRWPDGRVQWLSWDIRPWHISPDKIGGLLMYTLDITAIKEKENDYLEQGNL